MYLATFVLLLSFSAFFIETVKIGSLQEPIFTEEDVESMREQSSQLYGASGNPLRLSEETRLHTDARVMVVLMDGLRFDHGLLHALDCRRCHACLASWPRPTHQLTCPSMPLWLFVQWENSRFGTKIRMWQAAPMRQRVCRGTTLLCSERSASCPA